MISQVGHFSQCLQHLLTCWPYLGRSAGRSQVTYASWKLEELTLNGEVSADHLRCISCSPLKHALDTQTLVEGHCKMLDGLSFDVALDSTGHVLQVEDGHRVLRGQVCFELLRQEMVHLLLSLKSGTKLSDRHTHIWPAFHLGKIIFIFKLDPFNRK